MSRIDYTKELDWLYKGSVKKPDFVDVPSFNFLMIDGSGDPNRSKFFREAMYLVFNVAWTIKTLPGHKQKSPGYFDYVIPPIEGLWWTDSGKFSWQRKNDWKWTIMIMQPEFVDRKLVEDVVLELSERKPDRLYAKVRFDNYHEGICVKMLHNNLYQNIPETLDKMSQLLKVKGLVDSGKVHEIFLTDPRKIPADNYRTLLRIPVKQIEK